MVALVVIASVLVYIFVGFVIGITGYNYITTKHPYWYSDDVAMGMAAFGFFWPVSWLLVALFVGMRGAILGTVDYVNRKILKED